MTTAPRSAKPGQQHEIAGITPQFPAFSCSFADIASTGKADQHFMVCIRRITAKLSVISGRDLGGSWLQRRPRRCCALACCRRLENSAHNPSIQVAQCSLVSIQSGARRSVLPSTTPTTSFSPWLGGWSTDAIALGMWCVKRRHLLRDRFLRRGIETRIPIADLSPGCYRARRFHRAKHQASARKIWHTPHPQAHPR